MKKSADHKGNTDVLGIVDNQSLRVVGQGQLDAADELAVQEKEVRLVKITKLPGDMVPLVISDPGWVGAGPTPGPGVLEEETAGVVVRVSAARGTHETGGRDKPILQRAGACKTVKGEVPAPAHTDWEAQTFVFRPADVHIGVPVFEAACARVTHPCFDRPRRCTGPEVKFVIVGRSNQQVGVVGAAVESRAGGEARVGTPLRLAVGAQGQLVVAANVAGLVAFAFVEVVQHNCMFIRFKRSEWARTQGRSSSKQE